MVSGVASVSTCSNYLGQELAQSCHLLLFFPLAFEPDGLSQVWTLLLSGHGTKESRVKEEPAAGQTRLIAPAMDCHSHPVHLTLPLSGLPLDFDYCFWLGPTWVPWGLCYLFIHTLKPVSKSPWLYIHIYLYLSLVSPHCFCLLICFCFSFVLSVLSLLLTSCTFLRSLHPILCTGNLTMGTSNTSLTTAKKYYYHIIDFFLWLRK